MDLAQVGFILLGFRPLFPLPAQLEDEARAEGKEAEEARDREGRRRPTADPTGSSGAPKPASAAACPSPTGRAGLCTAGRVGSRPVGGRARPSPPPGPAAHARWTAPGCPPPVAPLVAGLAG